MSYVMSDALQTAVFGALTGDAALMALVDGAIYDALPSGTVPVLYVTLGNEKVRDRSDFAIRAALHEFSVVVTSDQPGFLPAKAAAARVAEILDGADLSLSRGRLVRLDFVKANARPRGRKREVETWFRAFLEDVVQA